MRPLFRGLGFLVGLTVVGCATPGMRFTAEGGPSR